MGERITRSASDNCHLLKENKVSDGTILRTPLGKGRIVVGYWRHVKETRRATRVLAAFAQQQSGSPIQTFWQQHGESESFSQWRRRFSQQLLVRLALLDTSCSSTRAEAIELILISGARLRITAGVDAAALRLRARHGMAVTCRPGAS